MDHGNGSYSPADKNDSLSSVTHEVKDHAKGAAHDIAHYAEARAHALQDSMANASKDLSRALDAAAESLRGSESWLAEPVEDLAEQLDHFAQKGHDHSLRQMKGDMVGMARRNPIACIGGAVALGFLLSRVLKADLPADENALSRTHGPGGHSYLNASPQRFGDSPDVTDRRATSSVDGSDERT